MDRLSPLAVNGERQGWVRGWVGRYSWVGPYYSAGVVGIDLELKEMLETRGGETPFLAFASPASVPATGEGF